MGTCGHQVLRPKTSNGFSRGIELREGSERRFGARITVWRQHARQMYAGGSNVCGTHLHASKIMVQAQSISSDIAVPKSARNYTGGQQLNLMSRSQILEIVLKSLQIDLCVGRHTGTVSVGEEKLSADGVRRWKCQGHCRVMKGHGDSGEGRVQRLDHKRDSSGHEIVLPQVGKNRGNGGAGVDGGAFGDGEV